MHSISTEKKELIKKLHDAIGYSSQRLIILKAINKKLSVKELITKLDIPQSTVSKAIIRLHSYGLITYIKKKENSKIYDKIPLLKQIGNLDKCVKIKIEDKDDNKLKQREIKVNSKFNIDVPFLDSKIEQDAAKMSESAYYILYLFENSIRKFIDIIISKKFGDDWWSLIGIKTELKNRVQSRKDKEGIYKWHVPRGEHEIFYTDLKDLPYFFEKEKDEFKKYLGDVAYWKTKIQKEIVLSRNIVDHNNPLPQREIKRIEQTFKDWKMQLKGIKL